MSVTPLLPSGREIPVQQLDTSLISTDHEWHIHPATNLTFRNVVEESSNPRTDIVRYKQIANVNVQQSKNCFSILCASSTLFRVPDTLACDRTFTRDVEEVYYLSCMDTYLKGFPEELTVSNLPILQRPLNNRQFCAFSRRHGYFTEHYERRRISLWLPFDSYENREFSDADLSGTFPRLESWYDNLKQPSAMPVPTPFVVYYFHKELCDAQNGNTNGNTERFRRLLFCLEHEFYILFIATWWNEAFYGGRQFVLDENAITFLDMYCGNVSEICGKPAQAILEHMRTAAHRPGVWHNWLSFKDYCMEASTFIWAVEGSGIFDPNEHTGQRLCSRVDRQISRTRYCSSIFRRTSVMEQRAKVPDLDRIDGLNSIVREQGLNAHGNMRVGDLCYHLIHLNRATNAKLSDALRDLDDRSRQLVLTQRQLSDTLSRCDASEDRLEATRRRLDAMEGRLNDTFKRLDNANQLLHDQRRSALCSAEKQQPAENSQAVDHSEEDPNAESNRTNFEKAGSHAAHNSGVPSQTPEQVLRKNPAKSPFQQSRSKYHLSHLFVDTSTGAAKQSAATTELEKQPSGNFPWLLKRVPRKRLNENTNIQEKQESARAASASSSQIHDNLSSKVDTVLDSMLTRHPSNTAHMLRSRMNQKWRSS